MKKILFISLALCCVFAAFGQNGKPKTQAQPEKVKPKVEVNRVVVLQNNNSIYLIIGLLKTN